MHDFWSAEDYYGLVRTFKYDQEKVVLDKYSIFEANRSRVIYNWLQYYSLDTLTKEFAENGFKIGEALTDTVGTPYSKGMAEIAVVAQKRDYLRSINEYGDTYNLCHSIPTLSVSTSNALIRVKRRPFF